MFEYRVVSHGSPTREKKYSFITFSKQTLYQTIGARKSKKEWKFLSNLKSNTVFELLHNRLDIS